jgi:2-iminobutanoate/2-iminopropanoate deaminase
VFVGSKQEHIAMEKQIFRVEPFATYAERRKVPISLVVAHAGLIYVSQMPPYDPLTGEVGKFSVAEQMEVVIKQMEQCLQAAGSALSKVVQCTLYCNDSAHLQTVNAVYGRFFETNPPARNLIFVSGWHGPFNVEVSCIAAA